MISKVYAKSRSWMNSNRYKLLEQPYNRIISISCDTECAPLKFPVIHLEKGHVRLYRFSDIEHEGEAITIRSHALGDLRETLMTLDQARSMVDFIMGLKCDMFHGYTLYINCFAGISRSGAVARHVFNTGATDMSESEFTRENSRIDPNFHVLELLRDAHYEYIASRKPMC